MKSEKRGAWGTYFWHVTRELTVALECEGQFPCRIFSCFLLNHILDAIFDIDAGLCGFAFQLHAA